MTLEQLKNLYEAQPFQAFTMQMADGRGIPVVSREFIMAPPTGRTVVVYHPTDDAFHIIDLLLVTDLVIKGTKNGSKRKRA